MDADLSKALKDHGLGNEAVWEHKQSRQMIMKHWACEHVAIKAGISFDAPVIIFADPANKIATICVTGRLGERSEWSFGEAAPYNTQQTYPFAMAEKRAKDRVILKLIGLHGKVYSEEEADSFKAENHPVVEAMREGVKEGEKAQDWQGPLKVTALKSELREMGGAVANCNTREQLDDLLAAYSAPYSQAHHDLPGWWERLSELIAKQETLIRNLDTVRM